MTTRRAAEDSGSRNNVPVCCTRRSDRPASAKERAAARRWSPCGCCGLNDAPALAGASWEWPWEDWAPPLRGGGGCVLLEDRPSGSRGGAHRPPHPENRPGKTFSSPSVQRIVFRPLGVSGWRGCGSGLRRVGVALLAVLNSLRVMRRRDEDFRKDHGSSPDTTMTDKNGRGYPPAVFVRRGTLFRYTTRKHPTRRIERSVSSSHLPRPCDTSPSVELPPGKLAVEREHLLVQLPSLVESGFSPEERAASACAASAPPSSWHGHPRESCAIRGALPRGSFWPQSTLRITRTHLHGAESALIPSMGHPSMRPSVRSACHAAPGEGCSTHRKHRYNRYDNAHFSHSQHLRESSLLSTE